MTLLISILVFLLVLFVLVLVHEWGHYIVAKKTGMRVDEFGIGFPPTLWSKKVGETVYALNAVPVGGYVKILGENGDGDEELSESDKSRTFSARPKWAQALVLVAGVTMNVLLAWVLLALIFMIGVQKPVTEAEAGPEAKLLVNSVLPGSPAFERIEIGSEIVAIKTAGGEEISSLTPSAFVDFIGSQSGQEFSITTRIGEETNSIKITPAKNLIAEEPDKAILGVGVALVEEERYLPHMALWKGGEQTIRLTWDIIVGVGSLIGGIFVGQADLSDVAGPVGIVGYVDDAVALGFTSILFFTAIISLNLAVINLLPIPALDGGRLIFVAIEAVIRRPINPIWSARVNTVGFLFLIGLMLLVTASDILKLF